MRNVFLEGNKAAVFSIILIKYINSLTLQRVYYCCFVFFGEGNKVAVYR